MKKVISAIAIFALAACTADTDDQATPTESSEMGTAGDVLEGEAPGFEAVAPGDYTVERVNGEIDNITIHPGMTFSRVAADGSATGGSIFMQDGKTCFVVEGVEGHNCFTDGPVQDDGSMQTTSDNGDVSTVRRVATGEDAAAGGSE